MKRLSENQKAVLHMACTHGHLTQGCRVQADYGGRACTIYSLRRLGLLDVMDTPTEYGRRVHEAGGKLVPNADVTGLAPRDDDK